MMSMINAQEKIKLSEKELIRQLIGNTLFNGYPFSLWKMPGHDTKQLIIAPKGVIRLKEINLEDSETGFVFAPFNPVEEKIVFPAEYHIEFENGTLKSKVNGTLLTKEQLPTELPFFTQNYVKAGDQDYIELVKNCVKQVERGAFDKIVPSRFKDVPVTSDFNLLDAFDSLCTQHPQALVSLVSSRETGTWLGATPELLVSIAQNKFKTVALAGTLPYSPSSDLRKVAWTQKEIEEQALVCRYIISCFKKIRLREYEEHGPKTSVAGNLMHLKTEFEVDLLTTNFPQLGSIMLKLLHPTSAVCGMPLDNAMEFLTNQEGYDREYYSGYLGPIHFKSESHLYVNLRCMQFYNDKVRLYAGAGVTADSIADAEWNETEIKMDNLLKIVTQ